MWFFLILLLIGVIGFLIIDRDKIGHLGSMVPFFSRGKDAGFKTNEISLLWKAAKLANVPKPNVLFFSMDELDKTLHILTSEYQLLTGRCDDEYIKMVTKKLFDYRKKVEFSKPGYRIGLKTTRDIAQNQLIKIKAEGVGVYDSVVTSISDTYLNVTYPKGPPLPTGFSWRGQKLNIYFWRKNDAGYFFQSKFIEYQDRKEKKYLRLAHSDHLLRSQKRRSVRAPSQFAAQLYRLSSIETAANNIEVNPGLFCVVVDISIDGAAIRISGKYKRGMAIKVQFKIRKHLVVVNGIIRTTTYYFDKDMSMIHIELIPPAERYQFIILSYVYDIDRSRKKENLKLQDKKLMHEEEVAKELFSIEELNDPESQDKKKIKKEIEEAETKNDVNKSDVPEGVERNNEQVVQPIPDDPMNLPKE